jgi:hypothetical protein
VIRGCITTGNPYEFLSQTGFYDATNNGAFQAITVSGSERMAVNFMYAVVGPPTPGAAPSGWTAGTASNTTTGTDAAYQTFRKDNVSSSTSADASNVTAGSGSYEFLGVSFIPPSTGTTSTKAGYGKENG